jgi:hypothetical protein
MFARASSGVIAELIIVSKYLAAPPFKLSRQLINYQFSSLAHSRTSASIAHISITSNLRAKRDWSSKKKLPLKIAIALFNREIPARGACVMRARPILRWMQQKHIDY